MSDVIEVEDLTKEYRGYPAVNGVSFRMITDESLGLVGPMGAGKSTLIKILAGLVRPTSGRALINGVPVTDPSKALERVGVVLDKTAFYPELTPTETLTYVGRLRNMGKVELPARIKEVLEQVGLKEWREKRLETFSRGMQQRLAVAMAILHEPQVLLLDEATSGLDPNSVHDVVDILRAQKREGRTILMTAHSFTEVADICDSLAILDRGRLLLKGDIEEVVRGARSSEIRVRVAAPPTAEQMRSVREHAGVQRLQQPEPRAMSMVYEGGESDRAKLLEFLGEIGLSVTAFKPRATLLEEVYERALAQTHGTGADAGADAGAGGDAGGGAAGEGGTGAGTADASGDEGRTGGGEEE